MEKIRLTIAVLITVIWGVVILLPVWVQNFDAPVAEVTPVMLLAATYLLGKDALSKIRNGNGNGKHR